MVAPVRTYLEADVKCYHCGHVSGVARVEPGPGKPVATFKPLDSDVETPIENRALLRCARCSGPTYFEEFELRQEFARINFLDDRPRRGRPPKRLVEQRGAA
ncbi:MAG TPA: hypothetical protein VEQ11_02255 [Chloroflexota bacterium]|nr:hypothetical protein [Chloroflexota bacterium]